MLRKDCGVCNITYVLRKVLFDSHDDRGMIILFTKI